MEVWPQDEPVVVVAWGKYRHYPGPKMVKGIKMTSPLDLTKYFVQHNLPQARFTITRVYRSRCSLVGYVTLESNAHVQVVVQHDLLKTLRRDPAADRRRERDDADADNRSRKKRRVWETGLDEDVQKSVFDQDGCANACLEILRHPANLVLPAP